MARARIVIRAASVLSMLQGVAHATLFVKAATPRRAADIAVVEAMREHQFYVQGLPRSYWTFYFGYGLMAAFVVVFQAALLWVLASHAQQSPRAVRSALVVIACYNLGHAALALGYFFYTPIAPDVIIASLLAAAAILLPRPAANEVPA